MAFVIATRKRTGEYLFMVDLTKVENKRKHWSLDVDNVFIYKRKQPALKRAEHMRYNEPQVMTLDEARRIARSAKILAERKSV